MVLHVGCGPQNKSGLKGFNSDDWHEVRFDIDSAVNPDILGTLTDMNLVQSSSVDAVFSSHNIEHIFPHEVPIALAEFYRVLKSDGIVVITCPDLQTVCEAVVKDKLLEPLYESPSGPISPIDILYGLAPIYNKAIITWLTNVASLIQLCHQFFYKLASKILLAEEEWEILIYGL